MELELNSWRNVLTLTHNEVVLYEGEKVVMVKLKSLAFHRQRNSEVIKLEMNSWRNVLSLTHNEVVL